MEARLLDFERDFQALVDEAQALCFAVRDIDLQNQTIGRIEDILLVSGELKQDLVDARIEDESNRILCAEKILEACKSELNMWIAIKSSEPHRAWSSLVNAQVATTWAIRAHQIGQQFVHWLRKLELIEKVVFPPKIFMSAGLLIRDARCSICGSQYGDCDHLQGVAYWGQFCVRVVHAFEALDLCIVENPVDKTCGLVTYTENGLTRDLLTLKTTVSEQESESNATFTAKIM